MTDDKIAAGASPSNPADEGLPAHPVTTPDKAVRSRRSGSTDDWVFELRRVLLGTLEPQRKALAKEGDADTLIRGWRDLEPLVAELQMFLKDVRTDVANIMDAECLNQKYVEDVGLVRRERRTVRKQWQSKDLLERVLLLALQDSDAIDLESGEVKDEAALKAAQDMGSALLNVLSFTGSTPWKVGTWNPDTRSYDGGIRELGLRPDEWCTEEQAAPTVSIPKKPLARKFEYDEPTLPEELEPNE